MRKAGTIAAAMLVAAGVLTSVQATAYTVSGRHIYDDAGRIVQLKGVNWFGFETTTTPCTGSGRATGSR